MFNKYALNDIESAMAQLRNTNNKNDACRKLKSALNKFFNDCECEDVFYTENDSHQFFGMCVHIELSSKNCRDILLDDKEFKLSKYKVEIDSKLFSEKMLNTKEATACLLHEIGHVVEDSNPTNMLRKAIDSYLHETKSEIKYVDANTYWDFLKLGIQDSFRRMNSMFCLNKHEIVADEFVVCCGYGNELESAFSKICTGGEIPGKSGNTLKSKLCIMDWVFQMYANLGAFRVSSIRTLNKMRTLTGSKLEIEALDEAIDALQKTNTSLQRECVFIGDTSVEVLNGSYLESTLEAGNLITRIQKKGLRGIEEDVFEYQMRIRNVSEEDEAICIMRQINTRMSLLDDWIESNPDDPNIGRYEKCYRKYDLLRDELSNKTTYAQKNYQIWFDYDSLDNKHIQGR